MRRIAILGSPDKAGTPGALERIRAWAAGRAEIVFADISYDSRRVLPLRPELLAVLGGDGTLIAAAHGLAGDQLPILGVNLGKLGFLAEFSVDQIERDGEFLFDGHIPVTRRVMLDVQLDRADGTGFSSPAVNDCVILAGPPFRMIEVNVEADGDPVLQVRGDGLIVATASGSTAHNLSAGGPILEPTAEAFVVTPICPHALTFRSVAISSRRTLVIRAIEANEGTAVVIDGRERRTLTIGDRLVISRYAADFLLVRNPASSVWSALRRKLRWGEGPNMDGSTTN